MREVLAATQRNYVAQLRLVKIIVNFARCMVPLNLEWMEQGMQV